jgi:hypothetical protein
MKGEIDIAVGTLSLLIIILAMIYGLCMGSFAMFRGADQFYRQLFATSFKVPALFVLTLLVTFPSLYVFNALVGSKLQVGAVFKLLIAALGVNITVLASLGPIVAFFSVSTTSYPFMLLLNVIVYAVSGFLGLSFLLQTLNRLTAVPLAKKDPIQESVQGPTLNKHMQPTAEDPALEPGALDTVDDIVIGPNAKKVFYCWIVVFGLVGAQMGWILRPFIGNPDQEFELFRQRGSNFFEAIINALGDLLS